MSDIAKLGVDIWIRDALENLSVADQVMQSSSVSKTRIAFVLIDNAVEILLRAYLKSNQVRLGKEFRDKEINVFPALFALVSKLSNVEIFKKEILLLHDTRNTLYHGSGNITVPEDIVSRYAGLAISLASQLHDVNENDLRLKLQNLTTYALRVTGGRADFVNATAKDESTDEFKTALSRTSIVFWVTLFAIGYLFLRPQFYVLGIGAGYFDWDTMIPTITILFVVGALDFFRVRRYTTLLDPWRWVVTIITITLFVQLFSVMLIFMMTDTYSIYFRNSVAGVWSERFSVLIPSALFALVLFLIVEAMFPFFYNRMRTLNPRHQILDSLKSLSLPRFSLPISMLRKRGISILIILILISSVLAQPIDASFGIFTPQIKDSAEGVHQDPSGFRDKILVDIFFDGGVGVPTKREEFYQLWTKSYEIRPPPMMRSLTSYTVTNIIVSNPAKSRSELSVGLPDLFSSSVGEQKLWVAAPSGVRIQGLPQNTSLEALSVDFREYSDIKPIIINITYAKKVEPNIQMSSSRIEITLNATAKQISYQVILKNQKTYLASTRNLYSSELLYSNVDENSVRVFRNETHLAGAYTSRRAIYVFSQIERGETVNFTLTFLSK